MATAAVPAWLQPELAFSLAAIVRRSGRVASIGTLKFLEETPPPDGMRVSVADLVDGIYITPQHEIDAHFSLYYQGPTQEDMVDLVRRMIEDDWEHEDSRWDEADDLDLFGDGLFSDIEDVFESDGGMTAFRNPPSDRGLASTYFPSGRPVVLPGRNDPCWCGSGKKYKHCHVRMDRLGDTG
ncbi:MAG: SEC-C domain-containing protein, partial [Anaerolineae bacterium]|nr:SEC-C domain-containing protein [Anaerolineae bacterium]